MASFLTDSESKMNLDTHIQFQVPGSSKQDRGKSWILDNNRIYAVADGHGVYGHIYAETAINISGVNFFIFSLVIFIIISQ